jgi:hypothetical protein
MKGLSMKSRRFPPARVWAFGAAALLSAGGIGVAGLDGFAGGPAFAASEDAPPGKVRRLTSTQYAAIIADLFGSSINIGGRFEPDLRVDGLLAVGAGQVSVSSAGLDQYDSMARSIASQVLSPENRKAMMPCVPASAAAPDDACAGKFLTKVGAALFRRPLTNDELQAQVVSANRATVTAKDFYTGLSLSLSSMLMSPEFLFRIEDVEADPEVRGGYRLTTVSKAQRLSFFLWNALPDQELMAAAQKGELNTKRGLAKQVDRMLASPHLEDGVRAFFDDMLRLDGMDGVVKDATIFPKFDSQIATDAREQTLRTIISVVLGPKGDFRDIFTTKKTFLTPKLASIYRVALPNDAPIGAPDSWDPYEFAPDDPRAGILMQTSFLTMNSHPGRTSATLRGKALREVMMCQTVPPPPANVKFEIVQDTSNPNYKTARARLTAHSASPACAGCHKIVDPMGLALENFDGGGAYRTNENGVALDTTGELDRVKFTNGAELGQAVRDNPATSACLVQRMSAYGLGRTPTKDETAWVGALKEAFAKEGYNVPALMKRLAISPEFYRAASAETKSASLN